MRIFPGKKIPESGIYDVPKKISCLPCEKPREEYRRKPAREMNKKIKLYIMWVYFLIYPLTNAYIPNISFGFVQMNPVRLYMLLPLGYLFHLLYINRGRIRISKESIFMVLYVILSLFNSWRMDHFIIANVLNFAFPVLFIIVIENLDFEEADFSRFYRVLTFLAVPVLLASLIQNFVNHTFYAGLRGERWLYRYIYGGGFRHSSIFRSIDFYQAGVAIGVLCMIFMFLNREKIQPKYMVLCFMMLISTYLTYTRSNWIIPLIAGAFLIHYKPLAKKVMIVSVTLLVSVTLFMLFARTIQNSEVYQERVADETYEGRFVSLEVYFNNFWGHNMLMGYGIDSSYSGLFHAFNRPEVHNGYLEVLFQNGFIGVFLYGSFWFYLYRRGKLVLNATGNGIFIAFIAVFMAMNMVYKFISMAHYGYQIMIFYLHMHYQVYVKRVTKEVTKVPKVTKVH